MTIMKPMWTRTKQQGAGVASESHYFGRGSRMDAVLIKRMLGVLLLLGVASVCVAEESSLIEQRVLKLVSERFVQAHSDLGNL